jgi:hypothetical protein
MQRAKILAIFVEDKLGQLADTTQALADAGVNIRWVTIATSDKFGVMKFLVDDAEKGMQALRNKGFTVSLNEVLAIEVQDKPGGLLEVAQTLAQHRVSVENASGFVIASQKKAVLILEVKDLETVEKLVRSKHLHVVSEEELLKL